MLNLSSEINPIEWPRIPRAKSGFPPDVEALRTRGERAELERGHAQRQVLVGHFFVGIGPLGMEPRANAVLLGIWETRIQPMM